MQKEHTIESRSSSVVCPDGVGLVLSWSMPDTGDPCSNVKITLNGLTNNPDNCTILSATYRFQKRVAGVGWVPVFNTYVFNTSSVDLSIYKRSFYSTSAFDFSNYQSNLTTSLGNGKYFVIETDNSATDLQVCVTIRTSCYEDCEDFTVCDTYPIYCE